MVKVTFEGTFQTFKGTFPTFGLLGCQEVAF